MHGGGGYATSARPDPLSCHPRMRARRHEHNQTELPMSRRDWSWATAESIAQQVRTVAETNGLQRRMPREPDDPDPPMDPPIAKDHRARAAAKWHSNMATKRIAMVVARPSL